MSACLMVFVSVDLSSWIKSKLMSCTINREKLSSDIFVDLFNSTVVGFFNFCGRRFL